MNVHARTRTCEQPLLLPLSPFTLHCCSYVLTSFFSFFSFFLLSFFLAHHNEFHNDSNNNNNHHTHTHKRLLQHRNYCHLCKRFVGSKPVVVVGPSPVVVVVVGREGEREGGRFVGSASVVVVVAVVVVVVVGMIYCSEEANSNIRDTLNSQTGTQACTSICVLCTCSVVFL